MTCGHDDSTINIVMGIIIIIIIITRLRKKSDDTFSCLDTIQECNRQTDGQTDTATYRRRKSTYKNVSGRQENEGLGARQ